MWKVRTALKTAKVGPALWILLEDMVYDTTRGRFTVPAGYLTDHASVPRAFTSVVPPVKSCVAEASVLHDWFYNKDSEDVPREFADECIKELTKARGGSCMLANVTWSAVRLGGGNLYNKSYYIEKLKTQAYPCYKYASQRLLNSIFKINKECE